MGLPWRLVFHFVLPDVGSIFHKECGSSCVKNGWRWLDGMSRFSLRKAAAELANARQTNGLAFGDSKHQRQAEQKVA